MNRNSLKRMLRISVFSALIAVSAMITIPFAIPVTLQSFAIFLALFALGGMDAFAAITIYVALGIVGLPVFAGFGAGIGYVMGASGGFIIAFPISALVFWGMEKCFGVKHGKLKILSSIPSLLLIYVIGALWFAFVYSDGIGFIAALTATVLPFLALDLIKIFLAYEVSRRLKILINFTQ